MPLAQAGTMTLSYLSVGFIRFSIDSQVYIPLSSQIGSVTLEQSQLVIVPTVPAMFAQLVGLIFTILTAVKLVHVQFKPMGHGRKRSFAGTFKILIMNLGSLIIFCSFILTREVNKKIFRGDTIFGSTRADHGFILCSVTVIPVLTSLCNPIVYLIFTPRSRRVNVVVNNNNNQ